MREQEMRLHVFRFLKARMRNMIMPAALGLGLAAGGCNDSGGAVVRYGAPVVFDARLDPDTAGERTLKLDAAPNPDISVAGDARAEVGADAVSEVEFSPDGSPLDVAAAEAAPDTRRLDGKDDLPLVRYGSPFDAGVSDGVIDSRTEDGQVIAKYVAPMPDAAVDTNGPVMRYMAVMPDAQPDRTMVLLYMAQVPS